MNSFSESSPAGFSSTTKVMRSWLRDFHANAPGNLAQAIKQLDERLHETHASPTLWTKVVQILLEDKEALAATKISQSGLSIYPQADTLRCLLGNALRVQGRYVESEHELRTVLAAKPGHELAKRSLAYLLRERGHLNAAAEVMLAHGPAVWDDPEEARSTATFLAQCGHHLDALRVCDASLAQCQSAPLLGLSGVLASTLGCFERAVTDLRQATRLNSGLATSWLWLALAHKFQTRDDPDLHAMEAVATKVADDTDVGICVGFALGKAYDDLGDIPAAVHVLEVANAAMAARAPWQGTKWQSLVDQQIAAPLPMPLTPPSFVPVFVVGLPRTGTTLVTNLLSRYSQVRNRGEMGWLPEIAGQFKSLGMPPRDFLTRAAALFAAQMRQDDEPARYYVDKNPFNFLHLGLASTLFPNARIIHCRRDPRDTALSIWRQHFGGANTGFAYRFPDIAQVVHGHDRLMKHWHAALPQPVFDLEYEALVSHPEETVAEVVDFLCNGDGSSFQLATRDRPSAVGTASLWQVRQPINTRSVGRWKDYAPFLPELATIRKP